MRVPLLLATLGLAACAEPADRPTDWSYLHATIIEPSCATIGCHSAATAQFNLDLSNPDDAFEGLSGVACDSAEPISNYLVQLPGDADIPLLLILRGEPWPGRTNEDYPQMPPDAPLTPAELALIEQWLEAGAPCE